VKRAGLPKPGDTFAIRRGPITTTQLVMFAVQKGLGGVIAHGMLTMAFAASCAVEAFGPASRISSIEARFTSPVRVGDVVEVTATVMERSAADHAIEATLTAEVDGRVVLRGVVEVTPAAVAMPEAQKS
jgi:acyl dehydratase